jgi:hypothetical protein
MSPPDDIDGLSAAELKDLLLKAFADSDESGQSFRSKADSDSD